jgi:cephalosporin hydroxylase
MTTFKDIPGFCNFYDLYGMMVNQATPQSHFVEVGALYGHSAAFMADCMRLSNKTFKFDVIDVWDESGVPEIKTAGDKMLGEVIGDKYWENRQDKLYVRFLQYMIDSDSLKYMTPIRLPSVEASKLYKDGNLDFVFIDAMHTYDAVKEDIAAWLPKVRVGGVLAGHDYDWPEVRRAVDEAFPNVGVMNTSWFINTVSLAK